MKGHAHLWLMGAVALAGCRGQISEDPPIHMNPNMQSQPRYDPQSEAKLFEDRRSMRQPVEGTVAHELLDEDDAYNLGRNGDKYVAKVPVPITDALLHRGQERFGIYCSPCHDKTGSGQGMVVKHGYPQATNLLDDYARHISDGQIYSAIRNGVRNMPSYAPQIPVADRWAIVAYVRALEISQNATIEDVPSDKRASLQVEQP
jgi:mono/diheme cytochrome c family protein